MSKLQFEDDYSTEISIQEQKESILLYISDELSVVDDIDNIPDEYESNILDFLSRSNEWYPINLDRIRLEVGTNIVIKLMSIYILTEPRESPLIFGLLYRISSDIEHGRGMKMNTDTMEIIEYGLGDVAFC